jgi:hypothetical protein
MGLIRLNFSPPIWRAAGGKRLQSIHALVYFGSLVVACIPLTLKPHAEMSKRQITLESRVVSLAPFYTWGCGVV